MTNNKKDIFLGFRAYTESDADIFKGRGQDAEYLYELVSNKDYVVCYAESGEGKSSLIDAGLTPKLRANRYFPVKISFTNDDFMNEEIDFDKVIKSRILDALSSLEETYGHAFLSITPKSDTILNDRFSDDLWWFLRHNSLSLYGIPLTTVLIFDQFEEVINYPKSSVWTSCFFKWLEKISSDNCPQYILDDISELDIEDMPQIITAKEFKALFSIRTEYIGELDYWCMQCYFIPALKHNRFCLKPLTIQGAEEVMRQYDGFDEELRDNILNVLVKSADNQSSESYVSALILSVVCTSLYQNNDKQLTVSYISGSLENFYNDIINKCGISIEERNVVASVLVDKDKRVRVASDCSVLDKISFNDKYKDALLQNRLVKKSIVNGVEYIELVHDSLIDVVKKHKEEALMKETRRKRLKYILSIIVLVIPIIFITLFINVKNNEEKLLKLQVKYCCTKSNELLLHNNIDAIRILIYLAENNDVCFNTDEYVKIVKYIDNSYTINRDERKIMYLGDAYDDNYVYLLSRLNIAKHKLTPLPEILSRWSEILGHNAELTKEEKQKYFLD